MTATQNRAVRAYRTRLARQGLKRFEVLGLDADRDLVRTLARRLAEGGPEASQLRAEVVRTLGSEPRKGGVLAALRRSPLVGADLDLTRSRETGRKVEL